MFLNVAVIYIFNFYCVDYSFHNEVPFTDLELVVPTEQVLTSKGCKRTRNSDTWKCNVNKKRCQACQEYESRNKVIRGKREIHNRKNCINCKFKFHIYFPTEEQQELLFNNFWGLNDDIKAHFYSENTKLIVKKTKRTLSILSRQQSFAYFFHLEGIPIRVCKPFFLNTLDIRQ